MGASHSSRAGKPVCPVQVISLHLGFKEQLYSPIQIIKLPQKILNIGKAGIIEDAARIEIDHEFPPRRVITHLGQYVAAFVIAALVVPQPYRHRLVILAGKVYMPVLELYRLTYRHSFCASAHDSFPHLPV
jgi:hypothetical protein